MENYELFIEHLKNHFDSNIVDDLIDSLDKELAKAKEQNDNTGS